MSRLVVAIRTVVLVCIVVALCHSAARSDSYQYLYQTSDGLRKLNVTATATWITNSLDPHYQMYQYQYVVAFTTSWSPKPLSNFGVANSGHLEWVDAYNSRPDRFTASSNPVYNPTNPNQNSILWSTTTTVPYAAGGSVTFGFYSRYYYDVSSSTAGGGGAIANGFTYGLVPEPATLTGLAFGLSGFAACFVRGRRRRT
ncbi:MAG: PEP-CTERM sorting domain-containing protein [Armatimonadota bacterium]|nr:PEP-CTERM sorting domain-containing protein [Armatimonadota bacterium]